MPRFFLMIGNQGYAYTDKFKTFEECQTYLRTVSRWPGMSAFMKNKFGRWVKEENGVYSVESRAIASLYKIDQDDAMSIPHMDSIILDASSVELGIFVAQIETQHNDRGQKASERREMTLAEVEKALGYKISIIS